MRTRKKSSSRSIRTSEHSQTEDNVHEYQFKGTDGDKESQTSRQTFAETAMRDQRPNPEHRF